MARSNSETLQKFADTCKQLYVVAFEKRIIEPIVDFLMSTWYRLKG